MKVLKSGTWNDPWSKQYDCINCKAVLQVEEGDVYSERRDQVVFKCAECETAVEIKLSDCHQRMQKKFQTKWGKISNYSDYGGRD